MDEQAILQTAHWSILNNWNEVETNLGTGTPEDILVKLIPIIDSCTGKSYDETLMNLLVPCLQALLPKLVNSYRAMKDRTVFLKVNLFIDKVIPLPQNF